MTSGRGIQYDMLELNDLLLTHGRSRYAEPIRRYSRYAAAARLIMTAHVVTYSKVRTPKRDHCSTDTALHKNEQRWPRSSKRRQRPPPPPVPSSSTRSTTTWCTIPSWITTGRSWPRPHRVRFYLCEGNVFIVFVCVLCWAVWSDTRYLERLLAKLKSVSPAYLFGLVPGTFAVGTSIGIASVVCSHRRSCQRNETSAVTASGLDSFPWMMCYP